MPELNCNTTLKKLISTVIRDQNRDKVLEYLNNLTTTPEWDTLLWTFPDLKEKYRQTLIALNQELVPNHISSQDIYSKLWELFKEIALNVEKYQTRIGQDNKLSEFYSEVKKPLTTYDILYEIKNFDIGESNFTVGTAELFKISAERLVNMRLVKNTTDVEDTIFNEWIGKSVIKTEVRISDLERAYESGLSIVNEVLDTVRLVAIKGRLYKLRDELFLWEFGKILTIPKVVHYEGTKVGISFHRGFYPKITPMGKEIEKELNDHKYWSFLFDASLPKEIHTCLYQAIRWIIQAVATAGLDFKIVYLITALEIMLLPDHKEGQKGYLLALRQLLLGRGVSYSLETILYLYEKRSNIIHSGALEITDYSSYWHLLDCCLEVLSNIINLSKQNPDTHNLTDLLGIVITPESLQDFIHSCEVGINRGKGIDKIKKAAEEHLAKLHGGSHHS